MNRNERCQNSFICFNNEKVTLVFVGLQYDSIKQNLTKNKTNANKRKKRKVHCSALQCVPMHTIETPQLFTPDESNMTPNDPRAILLYFTNSD